MVIACPPNRPLAHNSPNRWRSSSSSSREFGWVATASSLTTIASRRTVHNEPFAWASVRRCTLVNGPWRFSAPRSDEGRSMRRPVGERADARGLRGDGAQIVQGAAEQVFAKVEQAGPERAAVDRRLPLHRGGQALERTHEDGQLEIRGCDAMRLDAHACTVQHRLPVDELGAARLAEPRPPLRRVRLELQQVAAERLLQPGERGLD